LVPAITQEADAMKSVCPFRSKFASVIAGTLSCFDRVIFKGHLPISLPFAFANFVDHALQMRRCDFMKTTAPQWSERLVEHAKDFAAKYSRPYECRQGNVDKDAWAKEQKRRQPVTRGLIGILCVMETCAGGSPPRFGWAVREIPRRSHLA